MIIYRWIEKEKEQKQTFSMKKKRLSAIYDRHCFKGDKFLCADLSYDWALFSPTFIEGEYFEKSSYVVQRDSTAKSKIINLEKNLLTLQ